MRCRIDGHSVTLPSPRSTTRYQHEAVLELEPSCPCNGQHNRTRCLWTYSDANRHREPNCSAQRPRLTRIRLPNSRIAGVDAGRLKFTGAAILTDPPSRMPPTPAR